MMTSMPLIMSLCTLMSLCRIIPLIMSLCRIIPLIMSLCTLMSLCRIIRLIMSLCTPSSRHFCCVVAPPPRSNKTPRFLSCKHRTAAMDEKKIAHKINLDWPPFIPREALPGPARRCPNPDCGVGGGGWGGGVLPDNAPRVPDSGSSSVIKPLVS